MRNVFITRDGRGLLPEPDYGNLGDFFEDAVVVSPTPHDDILCHLVKIIQ